MGVSQKSDLVCECNVLIEKWNVDRLTNEKARAQHLAAANLRTVGGGALHRFFAIRATAIMFMLSSILGLVRGWFVVFTHISWSPNISTGSSFPWLTFFCDNFSTKPSVSE